MTDFSESTFQSKMELRNISHAFQTTSQYIAIKSFSSELTGLKICSLFFTILVTPELRVVNLSRSDFQWSSRQVMRLKKLPNLDNLMLTCHHVLSGIYKILKLVKRIFKNLLSPCTVCKSTLGHKICTGCIMVSSFTCSVFVK